MLGIDVNHFGPSRSLGLRDAGARWFMGAWSRGLLKEEVWSVATVPETQSCLVREHVQRKDTGSWPSGHPEARQWDAPQRHLLCCGVFIM